MKKVPPTHPLYDHQNHLLPPPKECPDPLCIRDAPCILCTLLPKSASIVARSSRSGWGGKRRGAGAPKGSLNHFKNGSRSSLLRHAVEVLAENKELRPYLLLIARAAVQGEIPQTTRRLILRSLGEKTLGMQSAASQLRRLRHEPSTTR
jgi:hypothetical protein